MSKQRILVVDDHFMVRQGLVASLSCEPDLEVIAEAASSGAALECYEQHRPDLVLMDVRLPGVSGVETTAMLRRRWPEARILMLSTHSAQEEVYRALQAGARGYVLKSAERGELLHAIREVCAGGRYLDPAVAPQAAERLRHAPLSAREMQVLRGIVQGRSNKEIASELNIAEVTVKLHVSHLFEKLGIANRNRTQATAVALQRGIISMD